MKRDEVWRIVQAKYEDYSDRVVHMVQELPTECRQSGNDSGLGDVWEEFKYQVQREESVMFGAYADPITAMCQNLVEKLPQHEQDLLWLVSQGYFDWNEEDASPDKTADVVNELYCHICSRASDEDLATTPDDEEVES